MGKESKGAKRKTEKHIIAIDYARFGNLRLYGMGIIESSDLKYIENLNIDYLGSLPSKIKRKKVASFRSIIRGVEDYIDLLISRKLDRIFNLVQTYDNDAIEVILDPKVWKAFNSRFSGEMKTGRMIIVREDKNALKRSGNTAILNFLNVVDWSLRWTKNLFEEGKANLFIRLKHGTLRKK